MANPEGILREPSELGHMPFAGSGSPRAAVRAAHARPQRRSVDRTAGCRAPLRLPPAGLPDSGESPNLSTAGLHIVFIISCELSAFCHLYISLPPWLTGHHCPHRVHISVCSGQRDISWGF